MSNDFHRRERKGLEEILRGLLIPDMSIDGFTVREIVNAELDQAATMAVDAGYSGSHSDGGARARVVALRMWLCGLNSALPSDFDDTLKELRKAKNPKDYEEFLRLKKIFEGE